MMNCAVEIGRSRLLDFLLPLLAFLGLCYPPLSAMLLHFDGANRILYGTLYFTVFYAWLICKKPLYSGYFLVLSIWLGYSIICSLQFSLFTEDLKSQISLIVPALLIFAVFTSIDSQTVLINCLKALVAGGTVLCIISFAGDGFRAENLRDMQGDFNSNELAYLLVLAFFALLCWFQSGCRQRKLVWALLALFGGVEVGLCSRKAFLGLGAFFILLFFCPQPRYWFTVRRCAMILCCGTILWYIFAYILPNTLLGQRLDEFLLEFGSQNAGTEFSERFDGRGSFYVDGSVLFLQNPWGNGFFAYQRLTGERLQAHSDYICILLDSGIVGALLYFGVYLALLWKSFCAWWYAAGPEKVLLGSVFSSIIVILLIATGRWNYNHLATFMYLGLCVAQIRLFNHAGAGVEKKGTR